MPPKSASESFRDLLLKHSHYLYKVENGTIQQMLAPYLRAKDEIYSKIVSLEGKIAGKDVPWALQRLRAQMAEIDAVLQVAAAEATGILGSVMLNVANHDAAMIQDSLSKTFGTIGVNVTSIPFWQVDTILNSPLRGESIGEKILWGNSQAVKLMLGELTQSIMQGEDIVRAARRLIDPVRKGLEGAAADVIKRRAMMIARSEILYVSNQVARQIFFNNRDILKGAQYVATLDNRTCLICGAQDGKIFPFLPNGDHKGPVLPIHPQCRCIYSPVTKSWEELGDKSLNPNIAPENRKNYFAGKPLEAPITYEEWLKGLDDKEVVDILGKKRYALWKSGKIKLSQMATSTDVLTVDELTKKAQS
jgi:SPP1 gp7 family putative phage head morphogenesis protein